MPNNCHSTTDCFVTAYCTPSINTHTHGSSAICSSPSPRCTDLATSLCYRRLSHHSHIPNAPPPSPSPPSPSLKSLCLPLPSKLNSRTGDNIVLETSTCWQEILNTFSAPVTHKEGAEGGGCCSFWYSLTELMAFLSVTLRKVETFCDLIDSWRECFSNFSHCSAQWKQVEICCYWKWN